MRYYKSPVGWNYLVYHDKENKQFVYIPLGSRWKEEKLG